MRVLTNYFYLLLCIGLLASCQTTSHIDQEKYNKRAKFHYQIGLDSLQRGQLPKSFDKLIQSNKITPNQPATHEALAYALRVKGNMEQSESFYKQAIAAGGTSSPFTNYGALLVSLQRYKEAENLLLKALEDPRYRKQYITLIHLGDALAGQNQPTKAIASYRKAALINPNQNISQLKEAQLYIKTGRLNYGQALYETILRKEPTLRPALEALIALFIKRSNINAARKHLANYLEKEKAPLNRAWANDELTRLGRL